MLVYALRNNKSCRYVFVTTFSLKLTIFFYKNLKNVENDGMIIFFIYYTQNLYILVVTIFYIKESCKFL